jgi:regulator of replication initiation timing
MTSEVHSALDSSLREAESVNRLLRERAQLRVEDEDFLIESYKMLKIENDMYKRKLAECQEYAVKYAEAEYDIAELKNKLHKQKEKRKIQNELYGNLPQIYF